jgi:hypothetical protein
MKLVIRIDPDTGELYGKILKPGEKLPPLIKPNIKKKKGEGPTEKERKN